MAEVKELKIVKVVNSSLFGVKFDGGGKLPKELTGMWTSPAKAESAISEYQAGKLKKADGKTNSD